MSDHPIENSLLPPTAAWPLMPWARYNSADLSVWGWIGTEAEVLGFSIICPSKVHAPAEATWVATFNADFSL